MCIIMNFICNPHLIKTCNSFLSSVFLVVHKAQKEFESHEISKHKILMSQVSLFNSEDSLH